MREVDSICVCCYRLCVECRLLQCQVNAVYPLILQCLGVLLLGSTIDFGKHWCYCFLCILHTITETQHLGQAVHFPPCKHGRDMWLRTI